MKLLIIKFELKVSVKLVSKTRYQTKAGDDIENKGLVVGYDKTFNNTVVGVATPTTKSDTESKDLITKAKAETSSKQLSIYAIKNFENFYVSSIVSYGINANESERNIQVGAINRTAMGEFNTNIFNTKLTIGAPVNSDRLYFHYNIQTE